MPEGIREIIEQPIVLTPYEPSNSRQIETGGRKLKKRRRTRKNSNKINSKRP